MVGARPPPPLFPPSLSFPRRWESRESAPTHWFPAELVLAKVGAEMTNGEVWSEYPESRGTTPCTVKRYRAPGSPPSTLTPSFPGNALVLTGAQPAPDDTDKRAGRYRRCTRKSSISRIIWRRSRARARSFHFYVFAPSSVYLHTAGVMYAGRTNSWKRGGLGGLIWKFPD